MVLCVICFLGLTRGGRMRKTITAIAIGALMTASSFARSEDSQIKRIQRLATEVATLTVVKLANQSQKNLNEIEKALRVSKRILTGQRGARPTSYVVCSSNLSFDVAMIQKMIEDAADDYMGMFPYDAKNFAGNWVDSYPCEFAEKYVENAKNLNEAADDYMGMFPFDAASYAKENADKLCSDVDIIARAKKYYELGRGRGMFPSDASTYAKLKIEEDGSLSCQMPKI